MLGPFQYCFYSLTHWIDSVKHGFAEGIAAMRLTTKGRFAVTAMIDLGLRDQDGPVTLSGIGERQQISLSYLEQLFGKLRRHRLVSSVRGPGGGYRLAKSAQTISVADIIMAVDEPIDATLCGGKGHCHSDEDNKKSVCMTHHLWTGLNVKMMEYLNSVSLAELVSQQQTGKTTVIKDQRIIRGSSMSRATTTASAPVTA